MNLPEPQTTTEKTLRCSRRLRWATMRGFRHFPLLAGRFLLLIMMLPQLSGAATTVFFPPPESPQDQRSDYQFALLQLALSRAGGEYDPKRSSEAMPQSRALEELMTCNRDIQVVASMTSIDRESRLLPIRIPIMRGLIGWRIPLVAADRPDLLEHVKTEADLKNFAAGQGPDWPDTEILRRNGLSVNAGGQYQSLFKMLAMHRFDYFPRSAIEIWPEIDEHVAKGLVADTHIVIHYPAAVYFFVCPHDERLAAALRNGLEKAVADGSFDRLFTFYFKKTLKRADIAHRAVIELNNPILPPETPLQRKELWLRPLRTF
jgi:hypothetical protein